MSHSAMFRTLLACLALGPPGVIDAFGAEAGEYWAGQTLLSHHGRLQPVEGKDGWDYVYVVPEVDQRLGVYREVLLDQPEIFIAADSP